MTPAGQFFLNDGARVFPGVEALAEGGVLQRPEAHIEAEAHQRRDLIRPPLGRRGDQGQDARAVKLLHVMGQQLLSLLLGDRHPHPHRAVFGACCSIAQRRNTRWALVRL